MMLLFTFFSLYFLFIYLLPPSSWEERKVGRSLCKYCTIPLSCLLFFFFFLKAQIILKINKQKSISQLEEYLIVF